MLCPWIRGTFSVAGNALRVSLMNTVLGVFPAGNSLYNIPLSTISGCILEKYYDTRMILIGIVMIFLGVVGAFEEGGFAFGLFLLLAGAFFVASGVKTVIRVQNNGTELVVSVPFYARDNANNIKKMIDEAIA